MTKRPKLNLAEMKALLPPVPVIATESLAHSCDGARFLP